MGLFIVQSMKTFQERLIWARNRTGRTQDQVAEFIGVKQGSYSDLESGKTQRSKYTAEIAHLLGVNAYWLATGKGSPDLVPGGPLLAVFNQLEEADQEALIRTAEGLVATSTRSRDQKQAD